MKFCVIGYGSIGKRHTDILKNLYPNSSIDIIDPFLGYIQKPTGTYDVGLVCTTTSNHLEAAESLLDKCGLIFIEKPLHTSVEALRDKKSLFANSNIHVGCNIRYTGAIDSLKKIKDPIMVRVTAMSNLLKWRHDPDRKAYSFHKDLGGGVLMDFVHEPDYVYSLYGLPRTSLVLQNRLQEHVTVDSDDACMMLWSYPDKFVSFCLSYGSEEYVRKIEVLTKDGKSETFHLVKEDIEKSYKRQWEDILTTGPKNSYLDCLELYEKMLERKDVVNY